MPLQSEDLKFGELNEKNSVSYLNDYLKTTLIKHQNNYSIIDFFNEDKSIYVELKSRRINHNKYPTAIIGLNKIRYLKKLNCEAYIAYKYDDGLFIIKYDKDTFKNFEIKRDFKTAFRADVGYDEKSDVILIPYQSLTKIL